MYILFTISALCFSALVFAAAAIARHVRSSEKPTHPQRDFAKHLFAAVTDQDSRIPRPLAHQGVKEVLAKINYQTPRIQANARNQSISSKRF
jgi:hypothetical protein